MPHRKMLRSALNNLAFAHHVSGSISLDDYATAATLMAAAPTLAANLDETDWQALDYACQWYTNNYLKPLACERLSRPVVAAARPIGTFPA